MRKKRLLVLCTANSARSQIAEGLMRHDYGEKFDVESAGTKATLVRPEAIAVMKEIGIDISGHRSKVVDEFAKFVACDAVFLGCPISPAIGWLNGRSMLLLTQDRLSLADLLVVVEEFQKHQPR